MSFILLSVTRGRAVVCLVGRSVHSMNERTNERLGARFHIRSSARIDYVSDDCVIDDDATVHCQYE